MPTQHPTQHGNRDGHFPITATSTLCHQTPLESHPCNLGAPFSVDTVSQVLVRGTLAVLAVQAELEVRTLEVQEVDRTWVVAAADMGDTPVVVRNTRLDVRWPCGTSRAAYLQTRVGGCCPG